MTLRKNTGAGFTLIELVVALAVLALLSALLAQGIRFGLRSWSALDARLSRAQAVATAQQALRGRLGQAYPYRSGASDASPAALLGASTELSFSAPPPQGEAGPLRRYRIFLAPDGRLMISWPGGGPEGQGGEEALLGGVATLAFDYFAGDGAKPGTWFSQWNDRAGLPALVRLRLQFVHGAAGDWPEFVARLRLDMPVDCQFDLVSRRCR